MAGRSQVPLARRSKVSSSLQPQSTCIYNVYDGQNTIFSLSKVSIHKLKLKHGLYSVPSGDDETEFCPEREVPFLHSSWC